MNLKDFHNVHEGERVFILGNGPSLQQTPLEKLDDEYTIALNNISKIYSDTEWIPSYFVFHDAVHKNWNQYGVDDWDIEGPSEDTVESVRETVKLGIPCFLSKPAERWFGKEENILFYNPATTHHHKQREVVKNEQIQSVWSEDITNYITAFASSITVSAQIAAYMGFNKLYFLGCDLYEPTIYQRMIFPESSHYKLIDFETQYKPTKLIELIRKSENGFRTTINSVYTIYIEDYIRKANQRGLLSSKIPYDTKSHFTEDYDSGTERSAYSRNQQMRRAHKLIKYASQKHGFEVYNATIGGHLEVYERVDLNDVLGSP